MHQCDALIHSVAVSRQGRIDRAYHAYQAPPLPNPPMPPSAGRSKVVKQRRYRKREGEYFNTLRDVIKELTGDEPQKRQEILMKGCCLIVIQQYGC